MGDLAPDGIRSLLNKKSAAYRNCQVDEQELSEEELAEFLADKPKALKRPILTNGHKVVLGFIEDEMKELL